MLISCSSCNSKYLINSADLGLEGRSVKCSICGETWHQKAISSQEKDFFINEDNFIEQKINKDTKEEFHNKTNLPSTIVKEQKPSLINSLLVLLIIIIIGFLFWIIKEENISFDISISLIELVKFYLSEFYFNLKLIINDIAKLDHQITN